jgi:hypothetical protein
MPAARSGSHGGHSTGAIGEKHQHLKRTAEVVVVELVGAYRCTTLWASGVARK